MPRVALLTALSILIWECKSFALGINTALCNRRQPTGWTQITREKKTTHRGSRLFGANNEDTLGQQDSGLATPDDLDGMRVSELKKMAQTLGLGSTSDCFEKKDLVERVRAVMQAARENTDDEADDGGPGQGMPDPTPQSPSTSSSTSSTSQPPSESSSPLFVGKNVRELRTIIHLAGLSSRGLLEKHEFLERAKEAQAILDARPKAPPDALRYDALEVQFYGRMGCPYCVQALELLKERGLPLGVELTSSTPTTMTAAAAAATTAMASTTGDSGSGIGGTTGSSSAVRPGTMLDVEKSPEAQAAFQQAVAAVASKSGGGGGSGVGVPYFFSPKTGKGAAGWRPGAVDLNWLVNALE